MIRHFVTSLSLFLLAGICSADTTSPSLENLPVTLQAETNTIRGMVRAIARSDASTSNHTIFIYEGNEDDFVATTKSLANSSLDDSNMGFISGQITTKVPVDRPAVTMQADGSSLAGFLREMETDFPIKWDKSVEHNAIFVRDKERVFPELAWPLDISLDKEDAASEMTYLEAWRVLDAKYGMNLPPVFNFNLPDVEFICPCNNETAWTPREGATVRDLLTSTLQTANACVRSKDRLAASYQIKAFKSMDGSRLEWTVISF